MSNQEVAIVSALRTPIGSFGGSLKNINAVELGAKAIEGVLKQTKLDVSEVDEVIMGNVLQAGLGQNPARQAAMKAGLPQSTPSYTINKVCGSGLKSVHLAAQSIMLGDADIVVAGGMENMSMAPYLLPDARSGYRMGDKRAVDSMIKDGLWCAFNDYHMGVTAENICSRYNISREEQDEFTQQSQEKATQATKEGKFKQEIIPIEIPQRKGESVHFTEDEFIKTDSTIDKLGTLRPAFAKDGSVTAGNASGLNDGAAAVLLMSKEKAEALKLPILSTIIANANAAIDPSVMGLGPIEATNNALKKADLSVENLDLIEANEAFASQSIAVRKELGFNRDIVNVNGGAIALGHPIGASGTRILVTLVHELQQREATYGLATLCIGGGQGIATIIKKG